MTPGGHGLDDATRPARALSPSRSSTSPATSTARASPAPPSRSRRRRPAGASPPTPRPSTRSTGDPRTLLPGAVGGGAWLLPSSARAQGVGAFWTTDLSLRNTSWSAMTATVKFLGHSGDGRDGPEAECRSARVASRAPYPDVLGSLFGLQSDYGPIRVTPSEAGLVVQGQTFTPGGGGTYGQSVPAVPPAGLIGAVPRSIVGVRQDALFRTNLMLANAGESPIDVDSPSSPRPAERRSRRGGSPSARSASRSSTSRTTSASTASRERPSSSRRRARAEPSPPTPR